MAESERNLAADEANGGPGNSLLSVEGVRVRGSLSIGMIDFLQGEMTDEPPVEED